MSLIVLSLGLLLGSGLAALLASRSPRMATWLGAGGACLGALVGLVPTLGVLLRGTALELRLPWAVPYGSFFIQIDPLTAFFLLPILILSALSAIYGGEYLWSYRRNRSLGTPWLFFNVLVAAMMLVVMARNGVLFLVAWEVMSASSFFLVTFEDEKESVRRAGWTYLVATHLGTAFLFALFVLLGRAAGSMDFDRFAAATPALGPLAGVLFVFAVVGFGTKAGMMPLHVWLPEAHPAATSHVSAVMSGVMIKTGIYGIVRMMMLLGPPPAWWGWLLIGVGLVSGIMGVLFALAQDELKRLLAYSTVENVGIILLGLGVGVLGLGTGHGALAALGFAGGLLHVLNHAFFKGLLFMGAGSILHATHGGRIEPLGGLLKKMPWTGALFALGSVAICGLPPLNGFIGEFLIYAGALGGGVNMSVWHAAVALTVVAGLALIGGLAVACFSKAFGLIFLGEPRSEQGSAAHDPGAAMRWPMAALAGLCLLIGLGAPWVLKLIAPVVAQVAGGVLASDPAVQASLAGMQGILLRVTGASVLFLALLGGLALLRRRLLAGRSVGAAGTWDCGYARPTARMQYTASSFVQPLTNLFFNFLRTRRKFVPPEGYFPQAARLKTETPDLCTERAYRPLFLGVERLLARLRWLQTGSIHLYILYIALTLISLLIWKLK